MSDAQRRAAAVWFAGEDPQPRVHWRDWYDPVSWRRWHDRAAWLPFGLFPHWRRWNDMRMRRDLRRFRAQP